MTYREEVFAAIDTLIDVCISHEGDKCAECEARLLCKCARPIDLLNNGNKSCCAHKCCLEQND